MAIVIYLPLLVCLVGWCMEFLPDPQKHSTVVATGTVMFWTGLLSFLLTYRSIASLAAYVR